MMSYHHNWGARTLRHCFMTGFAVAAALISFPAQGQEPTAWKVEEDWEMVIFQPDSSIYSPQITFFTSPNAELEETYFQLQMNYEADTDFSAGGFHVAAVHSGTIVDEERSDNRITLATSNDRIRWTSVMAVIDHKLLFAVKDGQGADWGNFGGPNYLVRVMHSPVSDLSGYRYRQSVADVDIGFGANRVQSVKLTRVRTFYTDGNVRTVEVGLQP